MAEKVPNSKYVKQNLLHCEELGFDAKDVVYVDKSNLTQ